VLGLMIAAGVLARLTAEFQHLFAHYGYPIIALAILGESAGIPLPGETVLLAAGVAAQRGAMHLPLVWALAAGAAILGDPVGVWIGHWGGRPLLARYGRVLRVREKHLQMLDLYYAKNGAKTVFFGRWVAFLRIWAALFAGAAQMPWRRFLVFNALGGLAWAISMSTLAYFFAASVGRIQATFGIAGWVLAVVVMVAVVVFVAREQRRGLRRLSLEVDEAESASANDSARDQGRQADPSRATDAPGGAGLAGPAAGGSPKPDATQAGDRDG
jgi:membrane protein DedA with SNARE-associated domain